MDPAIARIIDANLNRLKEGLRVVEEYVRFARKDAALAGQLRALRHTADASYTPDERQALMRHRDTQTDPGASGDESASIRRDAVEVVSANLKRVKEALRVLEEYTKVEDNSRAAAFKKLRFEVYALEQELFK